MINIDDLPVYVWPIIFENLSINDLFNCRLVNKKFKDFSNYSKGVYRLIIGRYNFNDNKFWHTNKEAFKEEDFINLNNFKRIKLLSIFNLDRTLKYLYIDKFDLFDRFYFEELSSYLKNLEYLALDNYPSVKVDQSINLSNLKFLLLNGICDFKLNLNVPKLEKINITSLDNITFESNPNSIQHLVINRHDNRFQIFKNLKIIELTSIKNKIDVLSFFLDLKQLKIRSNSYTSTLKTFIINALDKKINSRKDLDIYFNGVRIIDNLHFLAEYKMFNKLDYQLKNYNLLDLDQFTDTISYDLAENVFKNQIHNLPSNFFDVYSHVVNVNLIKSTENIDHFYWFLTKLKRKSIFVNLQSLILNQNFYDNLPNVIRALQIIQLNSNINFNFLSKLTNLYWFETDEEIDLFELAINLFLKLKCFKHFAFRFRSNKIRIQRDHQNFRLLIGLKLKEKELDFKKLIKLCNEIRYIDKIKSLI